MNGGRRNRRWQKGGYTLNEPKRHDIATVRSPERKKKASGIGGDRQKETHTKHTRRHNITTVRQPERKEAAGSGGDGSQMAYKHTLKTLNYFTTVRLSPRSGAGGTDGVGKVGTC